MTLTAVKKKKNRVPLSPVVFGRELVLDLYGCSIDTISDAGLIKGFPGKLFDASGMKANSEPIFSFSGEGIEGSRLFSIIQFSEEGSVTGHFSREYRAAYLNIFSCKEFDIERVESYSKKFFGASTVRSSFIVRK
ncbi:MAG: S-adenosylmethionine decarboxylase [Desulfatiglans sp.]|jgi:S-adenosylmethionine/arginine decarboxylase-like enzyme|nr:S-adenosylmethionine decarboxylase [Desulfatiglans sp.]